MNDLFREKHAQPPPPSPSNFHFPSVKSDQINRNNYIAFSYPGARRSSICTREKRSPRALRIQSNYSMSRVSKTCRLILVSSVVGLSYVSSSVRAELKAARQQLETNGERAKGLEENVSELRRVGLCCCRYCCDCGWTSGRSVLGLFIVFSIFQRT